MADINKHSRKRGRSEVNEEAGELQINPTKQSRSAPNSKHFANPQSFIPSTPKGFFLRLHLHLLKSLYDPDTFQLNYEGADGDLVEVKDDGEVQDDVFGAIEQFVKQRRQLSGLVHTVKLNKAVEETASKCLNDNDKEGEEHSPTPMAVPSNDVPKSIFALSSAMSLSSQQSPYGQRLLSGNYSSVLSQSSSKGANLLAALLKRKYLIANRTLRRETHVFQELLSNVKKRIETIETLLAELKGAPGLQSSESGTENQSPNASSSNQHQLPENEEMVARLETKHRLWEMLLKDMKAAYDL